METFKVKASKKWAGRIQALSRDHAEAEALTRLESDGKVRCKVKKEKEKEKKTKKTEQLEE